MATPAGISWRWLVIRGSERRELVGVAIQGTVAQMGEVALLAFDPAKGSAGLVDLSATSDIELVRLAGRSWMPERR
jgi:hypothetical protein